MSDFNNENSRTSDLGKKEYWDQLYTLELENFNEFGEEGEIWFGKNNVNRIIKWLRDNLVDKSAPILDVGCGNGYTLISLATIGFENLFGLDYSDEAVQLARKIADKRNNKIKFKTLDFLKPTENDADIVQNYHVIIDKGTYDAICLDQENIEKKREQYILQIQNLLSPEGYFLIFSCNWTKEELLLHFTKLKFHEEIDIPSIKFGGQMGQTVTAIVFQKNI